MIERQRRWDPIVVAPLTSFESSPVAVTRAGVRAEREREREREGKGKRSTKPMRRERSEDLEDR